MERSAYLHVFILTAPYIWDTNHANGTIRPKLIENCKRRCGFDGRNHVDRGEEQPDSSEVTI